MKKLIASLPWPESQLATLPPQITQLQQALARLNTQISTLEKAQEKHIGRVQTNASNHWRRSSGNTSNRN